MPLEEQGPREPQDAFHLRPNLYSNCGNFPNPILTGEWGPALSLLTVFILLCLSTYPRELVHTTSGDAKH